MSNKFKRYLNIDEKTLALTKSLMLEGYFKKRPFKKFLLLQEFNRGLSNIYKIKRKPIKIVSSKMANKKSSKDNTQFIIIGDQLSLLNFLAKFKAHMNKLKSDADKGEVNLKRDCYDWALSVLEGSCPTLIKKIIKEKEKMKEIEEEKVIQEELIHSIEMKGGQSK